MIIGRALSNLRLFFFSFFFSFFSLYEHCRNDLTCCVSLSSPKRFTVGDRVEGNWQLEGEYYSGIVTARVSSGNITIQYDDDASFETLPISSVRLEYPAHAAGSGSFDFRNRTNRQKPMQ